MKMKLLNKIFQLSYFFYNSMRKEVEVSLFFDGNFILPFCRKDKEKFIFCCVTLWVFDSNRIFRWYKASSIILSIS